MLRPLSWLNYALYAALILWPALGGAQPVNQTGPVTGGHVVEWFQSGVVADPGGSQDGAITALGLTGSGTPFCIQDAFSSSPGGYHALCLGANVLGGGAIISYNNYGGAAALPLQFNINGTVYNFPFAIGGILGPPSTTVGHLVLWNNTVGTLVSDGGLPGSVSSVGLALPASVFSVSGSPITAAGTLTGSLVNQAINVVWAGPSLGTPATPTFRALVGADLPTPAASTLGGVKSATAAIHNFGTGIDTSGNPTFGTIASGDLPIASVGNIGGSKPDGTTIAINGAGVLSALTNGGTVTSVSLAMPPIFSVSGSPVTSNGTLTVSLGSQPANLVWAGPTSGGSSPPTFRSLVAADFAAQNSNLVLAGPGSGGAATPTFRALVTSDLPGSVQGYSNNVLRGTTLSQWYNGTSITVGTSLGWTAEGVGCLETGATITASRVANPLTNPNSFYALKLLGNTSNSDVKCRFVIESYDAAKIAGQTVTFQIPIQNKIGASVTPTISSAYATAGQDNWGSSSIDLSTQNLQGCANNATCVLSYTLNVNAAANNGYEVVIDFSAVLNTQYVVIGGGYDLRLTPGVSTGINNSPPAPQIYPISTDADWSKRFFETTYTNGIAPGTITNLGALFALAATSGGAGGVLGSAWVYKVQKRCAASVTAYSPLSGTANEIYDITDGGNVGATLQFNNDSSVQWYGPSASATGNLIVHLTADCRIVGG